MREEGYSYRQIAATMSLPIATVHYNATHPPEQDFDPYASCGKTWGYKLHKRRGEIPCIPCYDAAARDQQRQRNKPVTDEAKALGKKLFENLDI